MRNIKQFTEALKILEKYNPTGEVIGINELGKDTSKQMSASERKLLEERGFLTQGGFWYFYDIPEEDEDESSRDARIEELKSKLNRY